MIDEKTLQTYLDEIKLPQRISHKGQNGKVMVIGGSELFHAASLWSLEVVSRIVDMVFYSSVPINNEIVRKMKENFHNGIVVRREEVESYIEEADVVLIGPGMQRSVENGKWSVENKWRELLLSGCAWEIKGDPHQKDVRIRSRVSNKPLSATILEKLRASIDWENDTYTVTNYLLAKYPDKKWVIDAGALQMCEPALLTSSMIITPHEKELRMVFDHYADWINDDFKGDSKIGEVVYVAGYQEHFDGLDFFNHPETEQAWIEEEMTHLSQSLNNATILLKGPTDHILHSTLHTPITGGKEGMTKGGTGDVLAGLVAGLYAFTNDPFSAAVVGSYVNKAAGDELYKTVGPFFNASDLVQQVPKTLKKTFGL